jgi:medium-chain acyl-[acyl-carrier-protein] hydrolase
VRLICLPFAGGSANHYWDWPTYLSPDVEVVAVQLPGRADRLAEAALDSVDPLADQLLDGLSPYLDLPLAIFGHSMGALIGFELVRRLRATGREPVHFFASGCPAPHLARDRSTDRHLLPDREFLSAVVAMDGVPREVLEEPELVELVLPALRSDFTLVETYGFRPQPPLSCPVSAFGGDHDAEVSRGEVEAWSCHALDRFRFRMLPGGHFFVNTCRPALLRLIDEELARV